MVENDPRLIVDTNIWLERLLDQDRANEVSRFLNTVPGRDLTISEFAFYSIGHILVEREQLLGFRRFVTDLFVDGHVSIVRRTGGDFYDVLGAIERYHLDFEDTYQYVAATSRELQLVSFDTDFDRTDIERLEPADVLDQCGRVEDRESRRHHPQRRCQGSAFLSRSSILCSAAHRARGAAGARLRPAERVSERVHAARLNFAGWRW